jgi:hypothetical protein
MRNFLTFEYAQWKFCFKITDLNYTAYSTKYMYMGKLLRTQS